MEANTITTTEYYELIKESLQCKNFIGLVGKNLTNVKFERKTFGNSNLNLSKTILSGLDLSEFNFVWAILNEANLDSCDLYLADLSNVKFQNASLKNADLRKANLLQADLTGANLTGADLSYADLRNANLSGANLTDAKLINANLAMACLKKVNFNNADLTKANLRSDTPEKRYSHNNNQYNFIDLKNANLEGVILKGTLYDEHTRFPIGFDPKETGAYLIAPDVSLEKADLSNADLSGANLSGANLSKANMTGVNLFKTNLSGANLTQAKIIIKAPVIASFKCSIANIKLEQTNLSQATIIGFRPARSCTYLKGANFQGSIFSDVSFECAELMGANFSDLNLNSVNFMDAKLTGANFRNCSLRGANFFRAVLHGVNFKGADLSGVTLQEYQIKDAIMPDDFNLKQNS